ncbi:MAG: hypothetical protein ABIY71_13735, partial [Flavobacteriales bacterium]
KMYLRRSISVGEKSRVPLGMEGMLAMAAKVSGAWRGFDRQDAKSAKNFTTECGRAVLDQPPRRQER